jgi:hypothetical protein
MRFFENVRPLIGNIARDTSVPNRSEQWSGRWLGQGERNGAPSFAAWSGSRAGLDENCGADGWAMTPSGTRGVLNDAVSIYFPDPALAGAFVARWCIGYKVETAGGAFRVREDEPTPRVGAGLHRTP